MSEAFEVSPDDTVGVAEAIRRAEAGSRVRLVRDGHAVAEIVPPARDSEERVERDTGATVTAGDDAELDAAGLAALEARMADLPAGSGRAGRIHAERFGAPTVAHYRAIYAQAGVPWPGEAFVRRHYPVADAC